MSDAIPVLMTYCPGTQCDPCKPKPTAGALYIEGNTWFTFAQSAGGNGQSYLCAPVFRIVALSQDLTVNDSISGSIQVTWHAYSVATPGNPSAPISGSYTLSSSGHPGGWYGEFPPVQYTELPKTYLGVEIDIGHGVTQDPPELTGGALWMGQNPPWHETYLTPLGTLVQVEQI